MEDVDLKILEDKSLWPSWPMLAVKRYINNKLHVASLFDEGLNMANLSGCRLLDVNMFSLKPGPLYPQVEGKTEYFYPSFEAMLADGWFVDFGGKEA